ncbi:thioesterase domain-containing protein, partial [Ascidiimonas sp. W6]|uniref:thioesterase domain-containing protein n=1 Tax=Ascidiimonas meishanensis TaxID=3128903 RepID=UPI0030ED7C49
LNLAPELISATSSFFELGGHSILASKLMHRIKGVFDVTIPLANIFKGPTLKNLASKIEESVHSGSKYKDNVIWLQEGNSNHETIFFVHDGSGKVEGYVALVKEMHQYNCIGLKFEEEKYDPETLKIEEIAQDYVEKIKAIQSKGPYYIAGWSIGGVITFEIAKQLEAIGEQVDTFFIDTYFNEEADEVSESISVDGEIALIKTLFESSFMDSYNFIDVRSLWDHYLQTPEFAQIPHQKLVDMIPPELKVMIPEIQNHTKKELIKITNTLRMLRMAADNYQMNCFLKGSSIFIKASASNTQTIILQKHIDKLEIQIVQGDHFSIMKQPTVKQLSEFIMDRFKYTLIPNE